MKMTPRIKMKKAQTFSLSEQSRSILRILVEEARMPDALVTYGELARRTGIANCALRVPMDHLSETLHDYAESRKVPLPPIQTMIVNSKTGVPGPGASRHIGAPYLKGSSYDKLPLRDQKALIAKIRSDIARFPEWDRIERELAPLL